MTHRFNRTILPIVMTLLIWCLGIYFRPILPVDETRYLSVAWEMSTQHSFVVPLLNGMPYAHKPPLLFWIILILWKAFHVSALLPRVLPLIFSIGNMMLVDDISARLWPDRYREISQMALVMLSASLVWSFFSSAVMFDMVLTFWVLAGIMGILMMVAENPKGWMMTGIAVGGGLLTKGPVIFVHLLPLMSFFLIYRGTGGDGFLKSVPFRSIGKALGLGLSIAMAWAIPAAITGGREFAEAIFWGQTAGRMVASFDHGRPFWWYLPILLLLIFPWGFRKTTWQGLTTLIQVDCLTKRDPGTWFCLIWFLGAFVLFSLISGKQLHYLLPEVPALMLLISKGIVRRSSHHSHAKDIDIILPLLYMALGVGLLLLPRFRLGGDLGFLELKTVLPVGAAIFALGGGMSLFRFKETGHRTTAVAISSIILVGSLYGFGGEIWQRYDLRDISLKIRSLQENGISVVNVGKYQGEFHFLGRLKRPIEEMDSIDAIDSSISHRSDHQPIAIVVRTESHTLFPGYEILHEQPYRSGRLLLLRTKIN